ncbi:MAG: DNA polymerase III subunit gamma/tau, partial [Bacteroidota bacterium]|nr:DNA polymerase III subunit gamma/tau [Bacteroidota bacterium]
VVHTLRNAIKLGRIAHAYLFCGPRGVGKTTTARIFAKALNCPSTTEGEPCNICDTCREISEGRSIDVLEIDGASNNGVEQVRTLRDSVRFIPARDRYKIYVIDEVHMLTKEAFNALLKTLEEPPEHALFIFATTEPQKLLPTVISRCQRHDFKRIGVADIVEQLRSIAAREGIRAEEEALFTIARKGDGSLRDAESIFDQVIAYGGSTLTAATVREVLHLVDEDLFFRITGMIAESDSAGGFALAEEISSRGYDFQDVLTGLEEHFRNLLVVRTTGETKLIEASEETRRRYGEEAARFPEGDLLRLLKLTSDAIQTLKFSPHPRLKFEIALVAMIKMDSTVLISDLLAQSRPPGPGSATAPAHPAASKVRNPSRSETASAVARSLSIEPTTSPVRAGTGSYTPIHEVSAPPAGRPASVPAQLSADPGQTATQPASAPHTETPVHPLVHTLMERLGAVLLPDS